MKKTVPFIVITCLSSWLVAAACYFLLGIRQGVSFNIMGMTYMLIPAIVAFCLQKFVYKKELKKDFKISFKFNKWFIISIITPAVISILTIYVSALFKDVSISWQAEGYIQRYSDMFSPEQISLMKEQLNMFPIFIFLIIILFTSMIAGSTINSLFAFGEELGWRGYMLHYLRKWSFLKVSVFTGIVWGLWHFPLILMGHNYPEHPVVGVFFMVIFCIFLSFISTYFVLKSNSVITAALFHGNINAIAGLPIIFLVGGNDLTVGITGISGFITMAIITLLFMLYDKYITKENIFFSTIETYQFQKK